MKRTCEKSESSHVVSVESSAWSSDHPRQRITLSMIATELESDLMKLRSRFAKATIRGYGIKASWPFISRR